MPQSTPERRARWGVMDGKATRYLASRGWTLRRDWHWSPPQVGYEPDETERDAIIFLIEEWDFGGILMRLPQYKSQKIVEAAKIHSFRSGEKETKIALVVGDEKIVHVVPNAFMEKHKPKTGWYFVRYPDGYESASPPKAFEEGYTRLGEEDLPAPAPQPPVLARAPTADEAEREHRGRACDIATSFIQRGERPNDFVRAADRVYQFIKNGTVGGNGG